MGTEIEINASGPKPVPLLFTSKQRSPAAAEPLLSPEASAAAIFPISSWPSFGSDSSWSQQEMPDGLRINIYNV